MAAPPSQVRQSRGADKNRLFVSPRLTLDDDVVFPAIDPEERQEVVQKQAEPHSQDPGILRLYANSSPEALKGGLLPQAAAQVHTLYLPAAEDLPNWLDVVQTKLPNLQHLFIADDPSDAEVLVRRLYILYRLPDLQSIDGEVVSIEERQLSQPSGSTKKRDDWSDVSVPSNTSYDRSGDPKMPVLEDDLEVKSSTSSAVQCDWRVACGMALLRRPRLKSKDMIKPKFSSRKQPPLQPRKPPKERNAVSPRMSPRPKPTPPPSLTLDASPRVELRISPRGSTSVVHLSPLNVPPSPSRHSPARQSPPILSAPSTPRSPVLSNRTAPHSDSRPRLSDRAIPASQSLTCPFPMQFRARAPHAITTAVDDSDNPSVPRAPITFQRAHSSPSYLGAPRLPPRTPSHAVLWTHKNEVRKQSILDGESEDDEDELAIVVEASVEEPVVVEDSVEEAAEEQLAA